MVVLEAEVALAEVEASAVEADLVEASAAADLAVAVPVADGSSFLVRFIFVMSSLKLDRGLLSVGRNKLAQIQFYYQ